MRFSGWMAGIGLAAFLSLPAAAAPQDKAEVALRAAMEKETVEGDVKAAIEQYKKLAQNGNKSVAARALVRLGECYEKQGNAEARKTYEQVLSKFGDQKEAVAQARARLAALGGLGAGMTYRRVWSGPKTDLYGTVSSDGRYLSYVDWETGDLALHDIVANADRRLTDAGPWTSASEYAQESAISRDGKQVAYAWYNTKRRFELRVLDLQVSGFPTPRQLFRSEDIRWIAPYDWSPDGKWLAVGLEQNDRSAQIGLLSPREGSLRVLKSAAGNPKKMLFSPDGKYLGLDLPAGEGNDRDIFVLTLGGGETKAVTGSSEDIMMGWSPDGQHLLFASDRSGSMGLWAIPMADGKPHGAPELVRPNVDLRSLGVTASGALYLGASINDRDIHVASLDFNTGRLLSPPVRPIQAYTGSNSQPEWSPDGKHLSYVRTRGDPEPGRPGGDRVLAIRSVETGQVRELQPNLSMIFLPRWAPDGQSFVFEGTDFQDRKGIYRIDAETGEVAPIVMSPPESRFRMPQWSPDGKKIYYTVTPHRGAALIERDLASGSERKLIRQAGLLYLSLSPDGRFVSGANFDSPSKSSSVLLIPIDGGEPRELLRVTAPQRFWPMVAWMPDGQGVVVRKFLSDTENAAEELWLVPVGSGQAEGTPGAK